MPDIDTKLAAALKQAKTIPMFFVFVAKGPDSKLLVEKKKISAKAASDVKKECGGGIIYRGRCQGAEGMMVFEVGKEVPGTLAALTKKIIKQDAGLMLEVQYRVVADLIEEGEIEEAPLGEGTSNGQTPSAPPPPNDAAARFAARLKALAPVLQKLETINKDAAAQARIQVAGANQAYLAKNLGEAHAGAVPGP